MLTKSREVIFILMRGKNLVFFPSRKQKGFRHLAVCLFFLGRPCLHMVYVDGVACLHIHYVDAVSCLHIVYVDAMACLHIVQVILLF